MESLANRIVNRLIKDSLIKTDEIDIYRFGIEITVLKVIHIICYFAIAFFLNREVEFIIIFSIFYVFRRNTGGFHAKTRVGCLMFSCTVILLSLMMVGLKVELWVMNVLLIMELLIILLVSPVQNKERNLDQEEISCFRNRLFLISTLFVIVYIGTGSFGQLQLLWLYIVGLSMVTILTIMGKIQCKKNSKIV